MSNVVCEATLSISLYMLTLISDNLNSWSGFTESVKSISAAVSFYLHLKNNIYVKHPARVSEETISGVKPLTNTYSNITRVCMMHILTHHRGIHRLLKATRCQKPYVFEQSERKAEIQKASNR